MKVESDKIVIFSPPTISGRSFKGAIFMIQPPDMARICYNTRRFERFRTTLHEWGRGFDSLKDHHFKSAFHPIKTGVKRTFSLSSAYTFIQPYTPQGVGDTLGDTK